MNQALPVAAPKTFEDGFEEGWRTVHADEPFHIPGHRTPASKTPYKHGYDKGREMARKTSPRDTRNQRLPGAGLGRVSEDGVLNDATLKPSPARPPAAKSGSHDHLVGRAPDPQR